MRGSGLMRIEKINDKQIRCTLNQKDLSERDLRVSELAYGTDKAKALFRDMMQQASYEFGFEADDIPLMIEAIPMYPDALILVITKVDDPDELDTRFSDFSDDAGDYEYANEGYALDGDPDSPAISDECAVDAGEPPQFPSDAGDVGTNDFISLTEALGIAAKPRASDLGQATSDVAKIFSFKSLGDLSMLADSLAGVCDARNAVYKDESAGCYYLLIYNSGLTPEEFNRACGIIGEYGSPVNGMYASRAFFEEHLVPLIRDDAVQTLAAL